jgi:hypothetical protein
MPYRRPALPVLVIPVLLAVAVLGYLAGHTHSHSAAPQRPPRAVTSGNVVLDYPAGWRAVSADARIPNLTLTRPSAIAPGGAVASAGLLVGTLPSGELAPLPRAFVAKLRRAPSTEIVNLLEVQAYRYARLSVPGFDKVLSLFVIPNRGGAPTALACYAPSASSAYMLACERSVAAATVTGQLQGYQLTPDPTYAAQISAAIAALDRVRVSLKHDLSPKVSAATAQQLARRLASGYSVASSALAVLEPSAEAAPVQAALAGAINKARAGYDALAAAAGEQDVSAYETAQRDIAAAETDVDQALESFALLGYGTALTSAGEASS